MRSKSRELLMKNGNLPNFSFYLASFSATNRIPMKMRNFFWVFLKYAVWMRYEETIRLSKMHFQFFC